MSSVAIFFIGLAFCLLLMLITWVYAQKMNYYSLVDVVWSYGIGLLTVVFAMTANGTHTKKLIAVVLASCWSIRLGTHLANRLKSHFPIEDSRYIGLKSKWEKAQFLIFFLFQGLSQALFSLPFLFLVQDKDPSISSLTVIGFFLFAAGFIGESVADKQLHAFRMSPENKGKVCDKGLWKYSRHPNYFFEWIIWCGIAIAAVPSPNGYFAILSPVVMYLTLNFLTGVPATEVQLLKSKGSLYIEYQRKTNRFFPGAPL